MPGHGKGRRAPKVFLAFLSKPPVDTVWSASLFVGPVEGPSVEAVSLVAQTLRGVARRAARPLLTQSGGETPRRAPRRPMAKPSDRDLVDLCKRGDRGAFEELVRRHQQRIHRLAVHMLRNAAEAEDVVQETFIRAYRAIDRFDGRSEPYTWFYRIAVNLSLNRIRARKSARATQDADDPRLDGLLADTRPGGDPGGAAARRELYVALCAAIDGLSDTLRTTLLLVCVDGRSHEEAGAILGAPEGTIAWRIHEARRKLREAMAARGFDVDGDGT